MKKITLYARIIDWTDSICFHLHRLYRSENHMHAVTRVSAYVTNRMRSVCNRRLLLTPSLDQSRKSKFREIRSVCVEYKIHMHKDKIRTSYAYAAQTFN